MVDIQRLLKLLFCGCGIYFTFIYYGTLQEEVFHFHDKNNKSFESAWFLQFIETLANVIISFIVRLIIGSNNEIPLLLFSLSGLTQVSSKAFTSLALANGVSFPIVTLSKSGKSLPVMIGSLLLGKTSYSFKEFLSCIAIIIGTCLVSLGCSSKKSKNSSILGLIFIILSLLCDGITGGLQNRIKSDLIIKNIKLNSYDFMFFTNFFMMLIAIIISLIFNEFQIGYIFCINNPLILNKIIKFAICSAIGQSFIFYTISTFDPYICSTITTTRKIFSVLLSIFIHKHNVNITGWCGILLASIGILSELLKESKNDNNKKIDTIDNDDFNNKNNNLDKNNIIIDNKIVENNTNNNTIKHRKRN